MAKKKAKVVRRLIGFTESQYKWLKQEARSLEISASEYIRRIIDEHRERRHTRKLGGNDD